MAISFTNNIMNSNINIKKIISPLFAGLMLLNSPVNAEILDSIVAVVDDDVIMASEMERKMDRIRRESAQRGAKLPPRAELEKQVLERLIMMNLQLQSAERNGIKVDDTMLNHAVSNIASENKISLADFRKTIESEGYDFEQFREDIREEITLSRLRQRQVDSRVYVSEREVKNYLATQSQQGNDVEEFRIQHILISVPEEADKDQRKAIKDEANTVLKKLQSGEDFAAIATEVSAAGNASEGGDMGWMEASRVPSLFSSRVAEMKKGDLSKLIKNDSGYHIIKLLDKRSSDIQMIPQTHARHILIRPNDLISEDEAKDRLVQLKERLLAGADFSELAKSHSDDKASAVQGGDLGWSSPGTMVPVFEKEMAELDVNELSEPFKSQFGWHIVQVLGHRQHDGTQELVNARARAAIKKRKVEEERQTWLIKLRDEAYVEYR